MILSAHQLHYLPWLRYFHKIVLSDVFVVMDNIQFNKSGWQNRNKIKCPAGDGWMYVSVPVYHKFQQNIDEVMIDNTQKWRQKHWNMLVCNYAKAPFFKDYKAFFEDIYRREWENLNDINYEMFYFYLEALGIKTKIIKASSLSVEGADTARLVNICRELGADTYLSGAYALDVYLDEKAFNDAGMQVQIQHWHCPSYCQQYMVKGFVPDLAIVDLLFNYGKESFDILMGQKQLTPSA